MDFDEFDTIVQKLRTKRPFWFESRRDPLASDESIRLAEEQLGVKFPSDYTRFLTAYGGGDFAFCNVFSVSPESHWSVVKCNAAAGVTHFLAISDDQSGGYYGFPVANGICGWKIVYYDYETLEMTPCYDDLFEYIWKVGLHGEM